MNMLRRSRRESVPKRDTGVKLGKSVIPTAMIIRKSSAAKQLDHFLRELGVIASFYQSLSEFWSECKGDLPELVLLDVQLMNEGDVSFRTHPLASSDTSFAFYYDSESFVLLRSTQDLEALCHLNGSAPLPAQLALLINLYRKQVELTRSEKAASAQIERLQKRVAKLLSEGEEERNFRTQMKKLHQFTSSVEKALPEQGPAHAISKALDEWSSILKYAWYQLENQQRLLPIVTNKAKEHQLPSLWLGQVCPSGILPFAEEMAMTVAYDLMGNDGTLLRVREHEGRVQKLLFIQYVSEDMFDFPWEELEQKLSAFFLQNSGAPSDSPEDKARPYFWEMLSAPLSEENGRFLVDFSELVDFALRSERNQFHHQAFYSEIVRQLNQVGGLQTQVAVLDRARLVIHIPKKRRDEVVHLLERFPYWKFFADDSLVMGKELFPSFTPVDPSRDQVVLKGQFADRGLRRFEGSTAHP